MNRNKKKLLTVLLFTVVIAFCAFGVQAENIDPDSTGCKYAWAENVGWINFKPSLGIGVTVTNTEITGMAWGENIGWINLSPANGGIANDGTGNLSGSAWGENVGWINFNPSGGGVSIGSDGTFTGQAWGENIGWISFGSTGAVPFCLKTAWKPASTTFAITTSGGANGSISPPGAVTVNSGADQTFAIAANTDYRIADVLVDGTSVGAVGSYTFSNVTANHTISASFASTPTTYAFSGFFSPVDNLPTVNVAKAGQTIPVKWQMNDGNGLPIADPAGFTSLTSYSVSCNSLSGDPTSAVDDYSAGSSGLQYLGDGYWQFNWKTPKTYAEQCRTMVLTLGDGTTHTASFKFNK